MPTVVNNNGAEVDDYDDGIVYVLFSSLFGRYWGTFMMITWLRIKRLNWGIELDKNEWR